MSRPRAALFGILLGSLACTFGGPQPALAVLNLRIEPSVGWRNLQGDAGDDYDDATVIGVAVSAGAPTFPLRLRAGIDRSSHDSRISGGDLSGTVLSLDVLYRMGIGGNGVHVLGGVARSNLELSDPSDELPLPNPYPRYEKGLTLARAGAGVSIGVLPLLDLFGEGVYSIGEKGRNADGSEGGRLEFLDLRVGAGIGF